jgi:hypothetical protein
MEVRSKLHALAALPWRVSPWHPFSEWLGGPQSMCESCGEEKNFLSLPRIELFLSGAACSLYRLRISFSDKV